MPGSAGVEVTTGPAAAAQPWLSVLVPVYNVEPYLRPCVESVLQQADEGVELLLLDDCSTDGSAALMAGLKQEHGARIHLLQHTHNQGLSAARNSLLLAARGTHIWFLDSDDWLAPAALPRLRELLLGRQEVPDLVFCDYCVARPRPRLKHRLRGEHHRSSFMRHARQPLLAPAQRLLAGGPALLESALASGNLFSWAHISRRSLWCAGTDRALGFPVGRSFEDMATTPHLLLRVASAWHEPLPWVQYRKRDDSISALMSAAKVRDLSCGLVGFRQALLQAWPQAPASTRVALAHQAARNLLASLRHAAHLPEREALAAAARADFAAVVGPDLPLLLRAYVWRGWWWRGLKLWRALRPASRP
jgi:glycosyltransferase involved in cell wall biosynthesis